MKRLLFIFTLIHTLTAPSQNSTILPGEKLTFTASYNMSGILTDLAEVTMETSEVKTSKSTLLRLKCTAATYSQWDNFFKVRDLYESYVNPTSLKPYLYKRDIDEGGYTKFEQYKYKHTDNSVQSLTKKVRKSGTIKDNKTITIKSGTKDIVATIYHLRSLDIHKAAPGSSDSFMVLFNNIETKVTFTYLKKEMINTNIGEKMCYKLAISMQGDDVLKGKNTNILWLTADAHKIPVYAKFKIPVGNGELKIKSVIGLKS